MIAALSIVGYIVIGMTVFRWHYIEGQRAIQEKRRARGMHDTYCDSTGKYRYRGGNQECDCPFPIVGSLFWPAVPVVYAAIGLAKLADMFLRPKVHPKGITKTEAKIAELEKELGL